MPRPSVRYGYREDVPQLAPGDITEAIRHQLWSLVFDIANKQVLASANYAPRAPFVWRFWTQQLEFPGDELALQWTIVTVPKLKSFFIGAPALAIYDAVEGALEALEDFSHFQIQFVRDVNRVFERHKAAWRFVGNQLIPFSSEEEVASLGETLESTDRFVALANTRHHFRAALDAFKNGDNPGAAGEALSALESFAKTVLKRDSATLGEVSQTLAKEAELHPTVGHALSKLYGWGSGDGGMRHGLSASDKPADEPEARFMIVTASAYINLFVDRLSKNGKL